MRISEAALYIVCLGILAGLTPAAASAQAKWKGTIVKEGELTVVKNPKEPVYKIPPLELREDFVLGGEAAEGKYVLSHPYDMAVDAMENLYVVDAGERNLKAFDKNGHYVKTIGRPGQGPGEFQFPTGICIISGTKEIIVLDIQRMSLFDPAGGFLRRFPIKGLSAGLQADGRGNLFIATVAIPSGLMTLQLYPAGMSGEPAAVLSCQQDQSYVVFKPRACWTLNQKGQVVFGDSKTYEIKIISSQGQVLKRILREYNPVRVTQEERGDLAARTKKVLGPEAAKTMEFASHHSAYRSFFLADGGRLFVQTWERSADGRQDIYDIFDDEGRYVARVPLSPNPDFQSPLPRFIKQGKLYTIEPDSKGYEVVKRYTLKWNIQDK